MSIEQSINDSGKLAIIYKPRENIWKKIRECLAGGENLYWLSFHSLFVPDIAVFGRWKKNYHLGRELGYGFDPDFFRFSQDPEELERVSNLIESGDCEVVKEFMIPNNLVAEAVKYFTAYQKQLIAREKAIEDWNKGKQQLTSDARYISNSCFNNSSLEIR